MLIKLAQQFDKKIKKKIMLIEEFCEHTEKKITGMEIDSTVVEAQKVVNKVAIN